MREIKMRAWDKEKNMMYNIVGYNPYDERFYCSHINDEKRIWYHYIPKDRIILMQYTGMKDTNDREIYEGDIVEGRIHVVAWSELRHDYYDKWVDVEPTVVKFRNFGISPFAYYIIKYVDVLEFDIRVIGNIHENPELVKGA